MVASYERVRLLVVVLVGIVVALPGCGSTSINEVTAPSTARCGVTASLSATSFTSSGGSGTVAVNANRECSWSVAAEAGWITPAKTTGQGEAELSFRVLPNAAPSPRRAALIVEGSRYEISQAGVPCRHELDTTTASVRPDGATVLVRVETLDGCGWTARSNASWISVTRNAAGDRSDVVELRVAPNSGAERRGTVSIAGESVAVVQQATVTTPTTPPPTPAPTPNPAPTPGPAPVPPPAPTPTPAPPAPSPTPDVEVEGPVTSLGGGCPDLTFSVNGTRVFTTASTKFRGGNCRHVEEGTRLLVAGERQSDGRVRAEGIDLR